MGVSTDSRRHFEEQSRSRMVEAARRLFSAPRRSAAAALLLAATAGPAFGQGVAAGPGANEIRIGNSIISILPRRNIMICGGRRLN